MDLFTKLGGISTGILDLDEIVGGHHSSELTIVGVDSEHDATILSLHLAARASIKSVVPSILFSYPTSKTRAQQGILCAQAYLDVNNFQNDTLTPQENARLTQWIQKIDQSPLVIIENALSLDGLVSAIIETHKKSSFELLVITELPSLDKDPTGSIPALRQLARELRVAIIAFSNVQIIEAYDSPPELSDFARLGINPTEVDNIWYFHRPESKGILKDSEGHSLADIAEIIVVQSQQGTTGSVYVEWLPRFERVRERELYDDTGLNL